MPSSVSDTDDSRQRQVDRQVKLAEMRRVQAAREAKAAAKKITEEDSGQVLPEWKWAR